MINEGDFGGFIRKKRLEKKMSIRKMAEAVGVSCVYLSDIEKNRRRPPRMDLVRKIAHVLGVNEEELMDFACVCRGEISEDLEMYLVQNKAARDAVRKAKEVGAGDSEWKKFLEIIKNKGMD